MDDLLTKAIQGRLAEDTSLDAGTRALITAACTGTPLEDAATATWPEAPDPPTTAATTHGVFLQGITVEGFRGIGPTKRLPLAPGPGLTLVVGRNGSGKSSFAEALEMCLTGQSTRWAGRASVWQETWRNLHHPTPATVAAELVGIDATPHTLTHTWPDGGDVLGGTSTLDDGRTLTDLGWTTPLAQYRPLLSFNEMGAMFDEPKRMYDAIAEILGVHDVRDAAERLRQVRLADEKPIKVVRTTHKTLIEQLRTSEDPRGQQVLGALAGRTWDLAAALTAIEEDTDAPTSDLSRLRTLSTLTTPHPADATTVATALRTAVAERQAAVATDAGRAGRIAALLRQAIDCIDHDGAMPCPLCGSGTLLDEGWVAGARQEAASLTAQATAVTAADKAMQTALAAARRLTPAVPDSIHTARFVGLDADAVLAAWTTLAEVPEDPSALADHLEAVVPALDAHAADLRRAAAAALDQLQDDWRPLAHAVARFVTDARSALAAEVRAKQAKVAEAWLTDVAADLERLRFEPISAAVQRYWERLRLSSNVSLSAVSLKRAGARRSLELAVTVDDTDASALGVMSQGELHALALSVFLPRATMDESPFRFVVLDDPVQAMDPARVDGLAEVLAEVATTRQVIVMTHDTRLADAVRRLQIPATTWEVTRRARSEVGLRQSEDPVDRYIRDARAMARTSGLTPTTRARVVAQMGRGAIEALCMDLVRRRRLSRGESHVAVEDLLAGQQGVHDLVGLAVFDTTDRGADVLPTLRTWFDGYPQVLLDCKRGTHVGEREIADEDFIRHLEGLVGKIRAKAPA